MAGNRTLWEEGRFGGRPVVVGALLVLVLTLAVDIAVSGRIGVLFDLVFVALCVGAALAIGPREFFVVGVLPPLLMAAAVSALSVLDRAAVAEPDDNFVQSVVSGLAHHATALMTGYALTLGILALRQLALRNDGRLRSPAAGQAGRIPEQRQGRRSNGDRPEPTTGADLSRPRP